MQKYFVVLPGAVLVAEEAVRRRCSFLAQGRPKAMFTTMSSIKSIILSQSSGSFLKSQTVCFKAGSGLSLQFWFCLTINIHLLEQNL